MRAVDACCNHASQPWALRVGAAIRAALELAEQDPAAGRVLVIHSAALGDETEFAAMVQRFANLLRWGAPKPYRSEAAARNSVLLVARQMLLHLETRPAAPLSEIAPGLIVFVLTPYVGLDEARRAAGS